MLERILNRAVEGNFGSAWLTPRHRRRVVLLKYHCEQYRGMIPTKNVNFSFYVLVKIIRHGEKRRDVFGQPTHGHFGQMMSENAGLSRARFDIRFLRHLSTTRSSDFAIALREKRQNELLD